jgi:hypothetical protein
MRVKAVGENGVFRGSKASAAGMNFLPKKHLCDALQCCVDKMIHGGLRRSKAIREVVHQVGWA